MAFRKWVTLVNGTTLYVNTSRVPRAAFRALESAGLCGRGKAKVSLNEPKEMNALLKKMGAKKMTGQEHRRFRAHLES